MVLTRQDTCRFLWIVLSPVRFLQFLTTLDSSAAQTFCSFPYIPSTYKESLEIRKLNQIWQTVPNKRISQQTSSNSSSRKQNKKSLHGSIPQKTINSAMSSILSRYSEYAENSYFLSLAMTRDIYNSIKENNVINLKETDENTPLTRADSTSSVSTCCSGTNSTKASHYRLSENVTFAEITNRLNNCCVSNNY